MKVPERPADKTGRLIDNEAFRHLEARNDERMVLEQLQSMRENQEKQRRLQLAKGGKAGSRLCSYN